MAAPLLLDTGPLVAYPNPNDEHHAWAVECWAETYAPFTTCEAVLSEAIFVLRSERMDCEPLLELFERDLVEVSFNFRRNRQDVSWLLRKYADISMSMADACLVRMAELNEKAKVFTIDRDFLIYRKKGRLMIPLLAPFA